MSETQRAVFQIHINAPVSRVWEAITKEGELLPHFYNSVMHTPALQPGSALRMRSKDGKFTAVVGDILEVDPPRRFAHTFKFTNLNDPVCKMVYELAPAADGGTDLTMIIEDLPVGTKTAKYMTGGLKFISTTLKGLLETGRPPFSSRLFLGLIGLFAFTTPAVCRTENWPFERKIE